MKRWMRAENDGKRVTGQCLKSGQLVQNSHSTGMLIYESVSMHMDGRGRENQSEKEREERREKEMEKKRERTILPSLSLSACCFVWPPNAGTHTLKVHRQDGGANKRERGGRE